MWKPQVIDTIGLFLVYSFSLSKLNSKDIQIVENLMIFCSIHHMGICRNVKIRL